MPRSQGTDSHSSSTSPSRSAARNRPRGQQRQTRQRRARRGTRTLASLPQPASLSVCESAIAIIDPLPRCNHPILRLVLQHPPPLHRSLRAAIPSRAIPSTTPPVVPPSTRVPVHCCPSRAWSSRPSPRARRNRPSFSQLSPPLPVYTLRATSDIVLRPGDAFPTCSPPRARPRQA